MRFIIRDHATALRQLGLDTPQGVAGFRGLQVQSGRQEVFIVETPESAETLYLKRIGEIKFKFEEIVLGLIRGKRSRVRREWENYLRLQASGIQTARPIAYGEDCGWLAERSTFIITAKAPGIALDQFLQNSKDASTRSAVLRSLALWIRKMHDAGIFFPDLYARHIFVQSGNETRFCLIDIVRLYRHRLAAQRARARDLAALNWSISADLLSTDERLAALRAYSNDSFPKLRGLIEKRTRQIAARRTSGGDGSAS